MSHIFKYFCLIFLTFSLSCQNENSQSSGNRANLDAREVFKWEPGVAPMISAHRGGPYPGFPENCIETFDNTLSYTKALIEFDVNTTKDGHLVLMHDDKVDRTTNGTGYVDGMTLAEIKNLRLKDNEGKITDFNVPTLAEVLQWAKEKGALVSVDVKRGVDFEKVIRLIEQTGAESHVSIIVYTVENAVKVHRLNPSLMISITIRNKDEFERVKKAGIPGKNVIAFTGIRLLARDHYKMLHDQGIFCILGTFGNLDRRAVIRGDHLYRDLIDKGVDIIATDRPKEAADALGILNNQKNF
ncbi:MAG: glycerophosphodiester phosphodiesterase family protein [Cytophagales bacterium]|nr:glycerophosphodiester phosphodiesterase family protein [Cytophagales bacterium]